jgi:hypothetical protein
VDLGLLIEDAWTASPLTMVVLGTSIGALALASLGRWLGWTSSKSLATAGLAASVAAFALTLADVAASHQRMLIIQGLVGSVMSPVPPDQVHIHLARELPLVRVLLGEVVGLLMPVAAWVWGRVHWPEQARRGLRWLATLGASIVAITAWGITDWTTEFIYTGFGNPAGCIPYGWPEVDESFESLDRVRTRAVGAGVLLAVLAGSYGVMQARQGRSLRMEGWVALLAFVSFAGIAKLWTLDERRDAEAAFAWQAYGHNHWPFLKYQADDPYKGPALDHCTFDWRGMNMLDMTSDYFRPESRDEWGERIDHCAESTGVGPILAAPELSIAKVEPALASAHAHGHSRFAVASVRPLLVDRATTDEFFRLQTCVVEFEVAADGVPIGVFATWGELAEAADAAQGTLTVALPNP